MPRSGSRVRAPSPAPVFPKASAANVWSGSAGHLGEAVLRSAPGSQVRRAWNRSEAIALHRRRRLDRRSRLRAAPDGRRHRRDPHRDAAQAACGDPQQAGISSTPTSPARSICSKRPWPPACAASSSPAPPARSARSSAPRAGQAAVWVTEDLRPVDRRTSTRTTKLMAEDALRAVLSRARPARRDLEDLALLPETMTILRGARLTRLENTRPTSCSIVGWSIGHAICSPSSARQDPRHRRRVRSVCELARMRRAALPDCAQSMPRADVRRREIDRCPSTTVAHESGWRPEFDFAHVLNSRARGPDFRLTRDRRKAITTRIWR